MEFVEENYNHSAERLDKPSQYLIRKAIRAGYNDSLYKAMSLATIYVGNLSHFTTEEQIHELFLKSGSIYRIIMGLDKFKLTPCGFCFVIYNQKEAAWNAVKYLNGTKLDAQLLEIDLDPGFKEGRQFGRGFYGGQASEEERSQRPSSRGGFYRGRGGRGRGRGRGGFRGNRGGYHNNNNNYSHNNNSTDHYGGTAEKRW